MTAVSGNTRKKQLIKWCSAVLLQQINRKVAFGGIYPTIFWNARLFSKQRVSQGKGFIENPIKKIAVA